MERLEKRFGTVAVESGFITPAQLVAAIKIQILDELNHGKYRLIGEILRDEGHMTKEQIDKVLESMKL